MSTYYKIVEAETREAQLVVCDYYNFQDSWVTFCLDIGGEPVVKLAIPGSGFWFQELSQAEYEQLLEQIDIEDNSFSEFEEADEEGDETYV